MKIIRSAALVITLVSISLSSNAAFIGVLPATSGGTDWQAFYDDQLDITWTADANINGSDRWADQITWVSNLTIEGVGGWRLPTVYRDIANTFVDCSSVTQAECMDSETGHLFFYGAGTTLGNGVTAASPGPFGNVQPDNYWSGLNPDENPSSNTAHAFNFDDGTKSITGKLGSEFAWAVRDGGANLVPIPAALWLFGSALGLLGWLRRKAT